MRMMSFVAGAFVLGLFYEPSFAQAPQASRGRDDGEWIEYVSRTDLFTVNFPADPTVREISYSTEYGLTIPGRVHSYDAGSSRYSVTVVDYGNVQKLHADQERPIGSFRRPDMADAEAHVAFVGAHHQPRGVHGLEGQRRRRVDQRPAQADVGDLQLLRAVERRQQIAVNVVPRVAAPVA